MEITDHKKFFENIFAQNAGREDIHEEDWKGGWSSIVGGINGIPTARQFNTLQYVSDFKDLYLYDKKLDKTGDASATTVGGKTLEDWFNELEDRFHNIDFTDYYNKNDIDNMLQKYIQKTQVVNNDQTSVAGYVADARIVKTHGDEIDAIRSNFTNLNTNFTNLNTDFSALYALVMNTYIRIYDGTVYFDANGRGYVNLTNDLPEARAVLFVQNKQLGGFDVLITGFQLVTNRRVLIGADMKTASADHCPISMGYLSSNI